jgi:predicted MPP superfamily phosphohydrolase
MTFLILTPALTCPSLAKREGYLDVLLLARTRNIRDDLLDLTYSQWDKDRKKKERNIDKTDIEILPFTPSLQHISSHVISTHGKKGFTKLIKVRIHISQKKGLYQLNNYSEDVTDILRTCATTSFFSEEPVRLHHPFYVGEQDYLNIAHISDSHICARMFMLEERWNSNYKNAWGASSLSDEKPGEFSNHVKQVAHILKSINEDKSIDIIIHTGDIVDYNRGYYNKEGENELSRDYYYNRNWLLFYELLLQHYKKPFFSVLGNHDYRLNPYPPNPVLISKSFWELYNMAPTVNLTRKEMSSIHEDPHAINITENHLITTSRSIRWYTLVINPALDYQVFYGKMAFLMLDWNKREDHERGTPWARNALSNPQWEMVRRWHKRVMKRRKRGKFVAIVAMHPSVFNPFPETGDRMLSETPETNIFYKSTLIDTYSPQKDLVDGTFRLRRNQFIRMCLGNSNYGKNGDYHVIPESSIDLVLTGHAHRSGLFQVKGPHVYSRREGAVEGPLFCNAVSCGPIGTKNEEGGPEMVQLVPPGYHVIAFNDNETVRIMNSDLVCIREKTRRDFGEIGRGSGFQVLDSVHDLPRLSPVYIWQVRNLEEGSAITRIRIATGLRNPVTVKSVPLGWRYRLEILNGFTVIVCEAHDVGQGIFYGDSGEISVKVELPSVEKMGIITISRGMASDLSSPVCVRVPAEMPAD